MKSFSMFKLSTSILAFAALVVTTSLQAATENGKAEVKIIRGGVASYSSAEVKTGILKIGQVLGEGITVTTGPGVVVELNLGENGQVLRIVENSSVSIDELKLDKTAADTVAKTSLTLKQGGLIGNVKKLSQASDYKVKYAEGVAGIRGTKWAILPGKGVICTEGSVKVTFTIDGKTSPPVNLEPNQIALPPLVAGGPVRVQTLPPEFVTFLVLLNEQFNGHFPGDRRDGPRRDIQIVVSANAGHNAETETTQNNE